MSDVRRDVQCRISTLTTVANFWGVLLLLVFKNEYLATANHAHGSGDDARRKSPLSVADQPVGRHPMFCKVAATD
jgi:hypothetical protein